MSHRLRALCALVVVLCTVGISPATVDAFQNGQAARAELGEIYIPGNTAYLSKQAAAGWNTMRQCSVRAGVELYPNASSTRPAQTAYRTLGQQQVLYALFRSGRGALAAFPGTSNHGLGRAIDTDPARMAPYIRSHGRPFGWGKIEAFGEAWHYNYVGGFSRPDPGLSQRYPVLRKGSGGPCQAIAVRELQRRLGLKQDGELGKATRNAVCNFQAEHALKADCVVGVATWDRLRSTSRGVRRPTTLRTEEAAGTAAPFAGIDVRAAQGLVNARRAELGLAQVDVDGVYGPGTAAAVRDIQERRALPATGKVDEATWAALRLPFNVAPAVALQRAMPGLSLERARELAPPARRAMVEGQITTPRRAAYFLAQIGHESVSLRYKREIASGRAYEGRRDLGNVFPGDGPRFKGGGFIQLTGRSNYTAAALVLRLPELVTNPAIVARDDVAWRVTVFFWRRGNLNSYSDRGDFTGLTRAINGGFNGLDDRRRRLAFAESVGRAIVLAEPPPRLTPYERRLRNELARAAGAELAATRSRARGQLRRIESRPRSADRAQRIRVLRRALRSSRPAARAKCERDPDCRVELAAGR